MLQKYADSMNIIMLNYCLPVYITELYNFRAEVMGK